MLKYRAVATYGNMQIFFPFEMDERADHHDVYMVAHQICAKLGFYYSHYEKVSECSDG